jgi:hypothetical protein
MKIKCDEKGRELLIDELLAINKFTPYDKNSVFGLIEVPEYLKDEINSLADNSRFKFGQWAKPVGGFYKVTYELIILKNYQHVA